MARRLIWIKTRQGQTDMRGKVSATVTGDYGWHRAYGRKGYTVTHIPSGHGVATFPNGYQARSLITHLISHNIVIPADMTIGNVPAELTAQVLPLIRLCRESAVSNQLVTA